MTRSYIVIVAVISSLGNGRVLSAEAPLVEKYLHAGQFWSLARSTWYSGFRGLPPLRI
jgi:hypothetical protein